MTRFVRRIDDLAISCIGVHVLMEPGTAPQTLSQVIDGCHVSPVWPVADQLESHTFMTLAQFPTDVPGVHCYIAALV